MTPESTPLKSTRLSLTCPWLKRLGVFGFIFFLIKGLLWIFLPGMLMYLGLAD